MHQIQDKPTKRELAQKVLEAQCKGELTVGTFIDFLNDFPRSSKLIVDFREIHAGAQFSIETENGTGKHFFKATTAVTIL